MKKSKVFSLSFCAIMASISIVLTIYEVNLPIFNVALYGLPLVFVSILFGPRYGFLTGLIAGSVEQIMKGLSIQSFVWIIAPLAWGGLSGSGKKGISYVRKTIQIERKWHKCQNRSNCRSHHLYDYGLHYCPESQPADKF